MSIVLMPPTVEPNGCTRMLWISQHLLRWACRCRALPNHWPPCQPAQPACAASTTSQASPAVGVPPPSAADPNSSERRPASTPSKLRTSPTSLEPAEHLPDGHAYAAPDQQAHKAANRAHREDLPQAHVPGAVVRGGLARRKVRDGAEEIDAHGQRDGSEHWRHARGEHHRAERRVERADVRRLAREEVVQAKVGDVQQAKHLHPAEAERLQGAAHTRCKHLRARREKGVRWLVGKWVRGPSLRNMVTFQKTKEGLQGCKTWRSRQSIFLGRASRNFCITSCHIGVGGICKPSESSVRISSSTDIFRSTGSTTLSRTECSASASVTASPRLHAALMQPTRGTHVAPMQPPCSLSAAPMLLPCAPMQLPCTAMRPPHAASMQLPCSSIAALRSPHAPHHAASMQPPYSLDIRTAPMLLGCCPMQRPCRVHAPPCTALPPHGSHVPPMWPRAG
eukprot:243287-Chlamydomonas_euryale.AAC.4